MLASWRKWVLGWFLLCGIDPLLGHCYGQQQSTTASQQSSASVQASTAQDHAARNVNAAGEPADSDDSQGVHAQVPAPDPASDDDNQLGLEFIRHLVTDQQAIWTSPFHLRPGDASWLVPLGAATAGFIATDPSTARAISNNPTTLSHYRTFSNYGLGALVAAGGGLYVMGKITHDEHKRETGLLAGEAAIGAFGANTALQYILGRERPYQDSGEGRFFHGGTSFPSNHAAAAWSIASVIAHEYPGPLTDFLVYGTATAIDVARIMGKEHYPSDVLVGSAMGWLIGREVYRRHHDPDLGGGDWGTLEGSAEEQRDHLNMGSPFEPLDSWVYPAIDRLAGLGYINSSFEGTRPWTRIECARLVDEASENIEQAASVPQAAAALEARLQQYFAYELGLLTGNQNLTEDLESVYGRAVSISGPALTDSYHFGQTISYDFGRPFERGTNGQIGGAFSASAGPLTLYLSAEYQHAPSAPALPSGAIAVIAERDATPPPPDVPVPGIDQVQLLDAYLGVNMHNWELTLGRQSVDWGPGPGGPLLWNNNIEPMDMARLVNPEPFELPSFLHFLGPMKFDQFFGRLEGHYYIRRPFLLGQKFSFKPLPSLEFGFGRTLEIGGQGPGATPLTAEQLAYGVFGRVYPGTNSVPGHSQSEFDWTFYVPRVGNYLVFYGDMYAADDPVPWFNPPKNPFRPGIYIPHFPKASKLDLHIEAADTESPGFNNPTLSSLESSGGNHGDLNYWNGEYRDGSTYNGFLIGNTVGRDGLAIQGWMNYWLSARDTLQFSYKNSTVSASFIPGGGKWEDYSWSNDLYMKSGFYLRGRVQYENISHFPILFNGPQHNVTAILEFGFMPRNREARAQGAAQP
jgi:membrane-associated phospholipid phosphatase